MSAEPSGVLLLNHEAIGHRTLDSPLYSTSFKASQNPPFSTSETLILLLLFVPFCSRVLFYLLLSELLYNCHECLLVLYDYIIIKQLCTLFSATLIMN